MFRHRLSKVICYPGKTFLCGAWCIFNKSINKLGTREYIERGGLKGDRHNSCWLLFKGIFVTISLSYPHTQSGCGERERERPKADFWWMYKPLAPSCHFCDSAQFGIAIARDQTNSTSWKFNLEFNIKCSLATRVKGQSHVCLVYLLILEASSTKQIFCPALFICFLDLLLTKLLVHLMPFY